jgi:N-acetylmuramoyl-L-alanine amidase
MFDETLDQPEMNNQDLELAYDVDSDALEDASDLNALEAAEEDGADFGTHADEARFATAARKNRYHWIIDNGHGKLQAGKRSPVLADGRQLLEYKFNRNVAVALMRMLKEGGYSFTDLVPNVESVGSYLTERIVKANSVNTPLPEIFVSIHANASGNGWSSANGLETWYFIASTKSKRIASEFQRQLMEELGLTDRGIRAHKQASKAFRVLRETTMPAVLTENGFYSNRDEVKKLLDPAFQAKVAKAHFDAIVRIEAVGIEALALYPKVSEIA